jgi:ubiquinone/menaquinone biosynthesis C-methylase UbiE
LILRTAWCLLLMSAYDVVAPTFDNHRALPAGVPEAIRTAVLKSACASPRLLDLGAGSGRIGSPFVAAGDDYVGVDLSSGMLREFAGRAAAHRSVSPRLVQANGELLPFRDATFDAVMLIQVFGGLRGWRRFIAEARRVLRPPGAIVVGRTEMPPDGIDARMKHRLGAILGELGAEKDRANARDDIAQWLESNAASSEGVTAATWTANRTPRGFIERHGSGARFAALPAPLKTQALRELGAWAAATFGSLDAVAPEPHAFALQIFKFHNGNP